MKFHLSLLICLFSNFAFARPGIECALDPNCGFGGVLKTGLLLAVIFVVAFVFEKIKNLFK